MISICPVCWSNLDRLATNTHLRTRYLAVILLYVDFVRDQEVYRCCGRLRRPQLLAGSRMDIDNWIESTRLANADTRLSPPERGIPNQHHGKKASFRSASPQSQRDRRPRVEPMPDETDPPRTYDPTKLSLSTHVRKQSGPSVLDHRVPSSRHSTNEDKQVHEPYTRRPRRKTRLDLYEPRRSDRKKRSRKRTRSANQDGPQSKNRRRKTSDILHTFHADNVKQDRLTVRTSNLWGLYIRG